MKKKKLFIFIGVGVLALIILIKSAGSSSNQIEVVVDSVKQRDIVETVSASGSVFPVIEVKISPEVSGEIIELPYEEGDYVQQGALLARINNAIYESLVTQSEAQLNQTKANANNTKEMAAQAEAQFQQAKLNFIRNKKLFDDKVISAQEFEQIETQFKSSKASYDALLSSSNGGQYSIKSASAALIQAKENLRKSTIFAPTSGTISKLNVKKGERVVGTAQMAGTELLSIADMDKMEVRVDVSETDIAKVKIGDSCTIETDAYRNKKFVGTVSKIAISSNKSSLSTGTDQITNYVVHILIHEKNKIDGPNGSVNYVFKPGMSASVEIQTTRVKNAVSVPISAVTTRAWPEDKNKQDAEHANIRQVVFCYQAASKKVMLRDVTTGIQDNQYIQISSGLKLNEQVVILPYGVISKILKDSLNVSTTSKEKLLESKEIND